MTLEINPTCRAINEIQRAVAEFIEKAKVGKLNAAMRADRAVGATATAAVLAVGNSSVSLSIQNRSVVSVNRHYGVSPPPLSSSTQSVRGMQLESPPVTGAPGHGSV